MGFDRSAWVEAGGHPDQLELFASIATVAPVAADDGRCLAAVHPRDPTLGVLWDWVGGDGSRLAAEAWLRSQGCAVVRAPMAVCTWFDHRANLGPFDDEPVAHEPMAPAEPWIRSNYREIRQYASVLLPHHQPVRSAVTPAASLSSSGWSIDTPAVGGAPELGERAFEAFVADMVTMAERVYGNEPEFAKVPLEVLLRYLRPLRPRLDARLLVRGFSPSGDLAALLWAYPDDLKPERGWFVLRTLFMSEEHRGFGLGSWMVGAAHQAARKAGYAAGLRSLVPVRSSDTARSGVRLVRRYALFEKAL